MIAMPETKELEAFQAAERVRSFMAGTPIFVGGQALFITKSCGVAQVVRGEQLWDVFRRADSALYQVKRTGRNRVESASETQAAVA